jgi:hypothetical protein
MSLGPLRSLLTEIRRRSLAKATASPGVLPSMAQSAREVHHPRALPARSVPPTGFLNLMTAYPSSYLAVLFHTACTCEVHPSESSPPSEPHRLSTAVALMSFHSPHPPPEGGRQKKSGRLQGFAPLGSPLRPTRRLKLAGARYSHGLHPL